MRTAVLLALLVILGIGIALACDGDGCEVVCEQTVENTYVSNEFLTEINQYSTVTPEKQRSFYYGPGVDIIHEFNKVFSTAIEYRYDVKQKGFADAHKAYLVAQFKI